MTNASSDRLDKIRGCMTGGAVGDTLGYPVEFISAISISARYGSDGITSYVYGRDGKAAFSDDTQMTLFTANGILLYDTAFSLNGAAGMPRSYIKKAYDNWLLTQNTGYENSRFLSRGFDSDIVSWLMDIPELYSLRAPGITCMGSLEALKGIDVIEDYITDVRNHSKGCGGVMRVAPVGLYGKFADIRALDIEGAQAAAITHCHPLGYMPAAVLAHVIYRLVYSADGKSLKDIVIEASSTVCELFAGNGYTDELRDLIDFSIELSENGKDDLTNIDMLGEGWVAEEALAIALYCSLRYTDDFSRGVIAAVNHSGDSDSTGAVTGNILGAICGFEAIEDKWKKDLELAGVILEMADDLYNGCPECKNGRVTDEKWQSKYVGMRYKK